MAQDKIYVGDIPQEYCYARFSDNHIDLYKNQNLTGVQDFYRIYLYDNSFNYEHLQTTYNQYNETIATYVVVTDDWHYRRDLPSICFLGLVEIMVIIIIFNLVSSVFKKGGVFSGLL